MDSKNKECKGCNYKKDKIDSLVCRTCDDNNHWNNYNWDEEK